MKRMLTTIALLLGWAVGLYSDTATKPQVAFYPTYFNRAACSTMQDLFNFANPKCQQYVLVFIASPDAEVTVFQVTISYIEPDGTAKIQTMFSEKLGDGTAYAAFSNDVTDITIKNVWVTPLKTAGPTVQAAP